MPNHLPERFQVAFSFAGEQRALVKEIAEKLRARLGEDSVFYDNTYEHILAGNDSDLLLQEIYEKRSAMVIVGVSGDYARKQWTAVESRVIRALEMRLSASEDGNARLRILPLRVGDGDVPWIPDNAICPDARSRPVEQTVQLILDRLKCIDASGAGTPAAAEPAPAPVADLSYDAGPIPFDSPWYIERRVDQQLINYFSRNGRTAALCGAPQMGKSSLAIRVEHRLQDSGYRLARVNIRDDLPAGAFADEGSFFAALTDAIARELNTTRPAAGRFAPHAAPSDFSTFLLSDVLPQAQGKVLMVLDRLDHLFDQPCSAQALSALRALHGRTANPPFNQMRMLLIHTLHPRQQQNPLGSVFDVAKKFPAGDFTLEEVRTLTARHALQLAAHAVPDLHWLLGGHPALTRLAWNEMADGQATPQELIAAAGRNGGPFENHLLALRREFLQNRPLAKAFLDLIRGTGRPTDQIFEALLLLGVVNGDWHGDATVRCGLYEKWFPLHLDA
ncbi:MAG TPA: AAA-like domain-containing protein [Chthoniobacteraceae bacterium]|jgi:hypothetical protein|nr:AAA-like domain-containing protein [Chthoniobacteraceae bacterium]